MNKIKSIAKKELKAYFGSPMAAIFIGAFLVATLFSFFWLEGFFARNTADLRPLFRWMPVLMIFLVAALTMRQWSEEQKMGTLEVLLTLPVSLGELVLGKFLAVLSLVAVALLLTFGLPLTVALLGNLDWGPVLGGYLGALLMAGAYIALGLYVSSRTDNQIIALIITVLLGSLLYLLGSAGITNFLGNTVANFFRALGTGSRFASIERGVIDLRDLLYYGTLTAFFLRLNVVSLDRKRWSNGLNTLSLRRQAVLFTLLLAANLLAANLWLHRVNNLRLDLTENREYSLSQASRDLLSGLHEPLLLRGYFSEKTHPLLSPLVPRIKDLMSEYAIASGGRVKVSFVDPKLDEKMEMEATQQYGIKPVPFQVDNRYEASVVNSYFNILVKYGDQYSVLGFNDLIVVEPRNDGGLDVRLRNLEYDLSKSIKKTAYGFQNLETVFENIKQEVELLAVVSGKSLPPPLAAIPALIDKVAADLRKESDGKLRYQRLDPDSGTPTAQELKNKYNLEPIPVSIFANQTFYLNLLLTIGGKAERVYLSGEMTEAEIRKEIEAVLKRTSSGFLKTVGVWSPPSNQPPMMAMQRPGSDEQYQTIQSMLRENYNVNKIDLASGRIPGPVDVLLLIAPQNLTDLERFAVDQYMMQGGAVVVLAANYQLDLAPNAQSLNIRKVENGLGELLRHHGIEVSDSLVMDKQNEPFPVPVTRDVGGFMVQEIKQLEYPYFVDVRGDGMDRRSAILSNLPAVTMNWVSPVVMDGEKNKERTVATLLQSSPQSWLSQGTDIQPDFKRYPKYGFALGQPLARSPLAVSVQGSFASAFAEAADPRLTAEEKPAALAPGQLPPAEGPGKGKKGIPLAPAIKKSPDSTRLVVVGSSEFVNDTVIGISQATNQSRFMNNLGFLQNIVDWSVEDQELLTIRARGTQARLLRPIDRQQEVFWESVNYGLALLALTVLSLYGGWRRRREAPMELVRQAATE